MEALFTTSYSLGETQGNPGLPSKHPVTHTTGCKPKPGTQAIVLFVSHKQFVSTWFNRAVQSERSILIAEDIKLNITKCDTCTVWLSINEHGKMQVSAKRHKQTFAVSSVYQSWWVTGNTHTHTPEQMKSREAVVINSNSQIFVALGHRISARTLKVDIIVLFIVYDL